MCVWSILTDAFKKVTIAELNEKSDKIEEIKKPT